MCSSDLMFEASVDGQPYDTERWGQYFRPAGVQAPGGNASHSDEDTPAPVVKAAPVAKAAPVDEDPPFDVDDTPAASAPVQAAKASSNTQDILAMIRARQNKS